MLDVYSSSLATCCTTLSTPVEGEFRAVISYLLQQGAKPEALGLIRLSTSIPFPHFKESLLAAVSSANNPFVPGMNLSVALTGAARRAKEGEKRALLIMQAAVDELLLEVFEHLPQTVRDFDGGMDTCSSVLEPETVISSQEGTTGPLGVALQQRKQMDTYCTAPLVVDFMWRKFTKGLLGFEEAKSILENINRLPTLEQPLYGDGLFAEHGVLLNGIALQRGYGNLKLSSSTYFPGTRFIVIGFLSRPYIYYNVPALRMVLDFVTYLCTMALFGGFVLLNDHKSFDWPEIVFAVYICGAIVTELRAIVKNPWEYALDRWNVLDVTSLCLMFVSLSFHAFGSGDGTMATSLYALSAPFAFTRILFYAQILPHQGPMIQAIFSMTTDLVRFGAMLFVVMSGFVMAFYTIVKENMSFGEVWLNLFKAMLGETSFFEEFSGTDFDDVASLLLATFVVLLTIMMLNLLAAALSTSHARIHNNIDREYKVSKARLIQHYVSVVKTDRLPAPFNLVQWVLSSPMFIVDWCCSTTTLHKDTQRFVGRTVFWAVLGPIAVAVGWLMWIASTPKAVPMVWRASAGKPFGVKLARTVIALASCTVVAPFWLTLIWAKGGLRRMRGVVDPARRQRGHVRRPRPDGVNKVGAASRVPLPDNGGDATRGLGEEDEDVVTAVLKATNRGAVVGELQKYLDDPMSDPYVRRDEETRATTMEHVKLLRNRLEATTKEHINELQSYFVLATEDLSRRVRGAAAATGGYNGRRRKIALAPGKLEDIFRTRVSELDRRLDAKTAELEEKVKTLIDERLEVVVQKLGVIIIKAGK